MKAPRGAEDQASDRWVVVKISGRLMSPPRPDYLRALSAAIRALRKEMGLAIVVGGGSLARDYISALRELGVPEARLDIVGIEAARLNALALSFVLYPLSSGVARTVEEALHNAASGLIPILGGLQPGQSTNAVAASLAEALGAKTLINMLAGTDGVYVPPPGQPGSRLVEEISYDEMAELIGSYPQLAGRYELLDHVALTIARRSSLEVVFVNGERPEALIKAARGERVGTILRGRARGEGGAARGNS